MSACVSLVDLPSTNHSMDHETAWADFELIFDREWTRHTAEPLPFDWTLEVNL